MGKGTAELEEIVVFIDGRTETAGILEFAGTLAQEHGARLISVFMQPEPTITPAETFARGKGMQSTIEVHRAQLERIEADHRAQFEDIVRRHGIRPESEWRSLPYLSTEVGVHAYYADLVVIARPESAGQTAGPPGLAESLVLSSGRPIIVFPPRGKVSQVRRILVAWNATRESIRAVADALPLLVKAKAVEVLVADHERNRAGHGQEPGADIARHLARHGVQVEVQRLSSGGKDVGPLLLSQAAAFGADLLVMGAYGHSQVREWMFGGVTRTVLYEAGLPVLMSR
jgi:nucleotide-binding universal stress UspA family protein